MPRAQAALEFLVTYGWAILVVLVMIGALAYFGVIDAKRFIPQKCMVSQGFSCTDYYLSKWDGGVNQCEVSFILKNNMGRPIRILANSTNITCDNCEYHPDIQYWRNCGHWRLQDTTLVAVNHGNDAVIGTDETFILECNSGDVYYIDFDTVGHKERVRFTFDYALLDSNFPHRVEGEILATVQEQKCGMRRCVYPPGDPTGDTTC